MPFLHTSVAVEPGACPQMGGVAGDIGDRLFTLDHSLLHSRLVARENAMAGWVGPLLHVGRDSPGMVHIGDNSGEQFPQVT